MKKYLKRINFSILLVILFSLVLFLPGFFTYFHQDDFIHLWHSQSLDQVIKAFNIFQKGEFPFFRPIPTQVYFYFGQKMFGLYPLGYHIINFLLFVLNILLVFRLVRFIGKKRQIAAIAVIFFAINSTHFAPLYSAAYVHELLYVFFGILTVDNFLRWGSNHQNKNYLASIIFLILTMMSKETAVILPGILFLTTYFISQKKNIISILKSLVPHLIILAIYLYGHFYYYGTATSSSYNLIIGRSNINILGWYFLWALSTPNVLIDFIGPGLKINPVFFQISTYHGAIYFIFFPILIMLGTLLLVRNHAKNIILGILWFIIGMLPLIIFPLHKLATEQAFSLVGLSIFLSVLTVDFYYSAKKYKILSVIFVAVYIIIAVNSILFARKTHWIVRSAQQAENVIVFIKIHYPKLKDGDTIYFRDGKIKIAPYGSSRQIYQATGNGVGLKLALNKPNLKLYFEEINSPSEGLRKDSSIIEIDSSKFLGY